MLLIYYQYLVMEYHWQKILLATWGLKPASLISANILANQQTIHLIIKGSIKSGDKQLLSLPFVHVFLHIMTGANFYDINIQLLYTIAHLMLLIYQQYLVMEQHLQKNLFPTWGLEPVSSISLNSRDHPLPQKKEADGPVDIARLFTDTGSSPHVANDVFFK